MTELSKIKTIWLAYAINIMYGTKPVLDIDVKKNLASKLFHLFHSGCIFKYNI